MSIYPPGPQSVPADISKPSAAYVRNARLAMFGLLLFIAVYLALLAWFTWTSYRLLSDLSLLYDDGTFLMQLLLGIGNAVFAVFLAKALIFRRPSPPPPIEITAAAEPELFAFIHRLVIEAKAPVPHRVYLSPEVNAAVFYDLSFVNLIFPTRKNLVIGTGLVNAVSLGEFKAVLAHEFGHFAQRSMAVGRWVYIAQQVAQQIVERRDFLDDALRKLSWFDPRIAWIAWVIRIVVWSLRSMLDVAFRLVVFAERALSREMEFQADLVAVSLTGSDALIHALHRIGAADDAFEQALEIAASELAQGRAVPDIHTLQTQALEQLRRILDDPKLGVSPELPNRDRAQHRVFESPTAQPPRMWSTHPPSRAREDNAKRHYIPCKIDERPAWVLFQNPTATRRQVTQHLLKGMSDSQPLEPLDEEGALASLARRFDRHYYNPRYRGAYLGRSCVREQALIGDLFEKHTVGNIDFASLYPESLRGDLTRWKTAISEKFTLEGLRDGRLRAPEGVIRYRGRVIEFRELTNALQEIDADVKRLRSDLVAHDRACRSIHWTAAYHLGKDWAAYHYSIVSLLHYADHSEGDIRDARRHLMRTIAVVTADEHVSDSERVQLVRSASDLHGCLWALHQQAPAVVLPDAICNALGVLGWSQALGERYQLPAPRDDIIGDWLGVIDGWFHATAQPFDALERACLQHLLEIEAHIEACTIEGRPAGPAPTPAVIPQEYRVMPTGHERQSPSKLSLWDRFYLADGLVPAIARTLVAVSIVGAVLFSGLYF